MKTPKNTDFEDAFDYAYKGYGREGSSISKLRMQALEVASRQTTFLAGDGHMLRLADKYLHYCLTGEHQLPEKKE